MPRATTPPVKRYIGDAVYAAVSADGTLELTTENGIVVTNRVVLEPLVLRGLLDFLELWATRLAAARVRPGAPLTPALAALLRNR